MSDETEFFIFLPITHYLSPITYSVNLLRMRMNFYSDLPMTHNPYFYT